MFCLKVVIREPSKCLPLPLALLRHLLFCFGILEQAMNILED